MSVDTGEEKEGSQLFQGSRVFFPSQSARLELIQRRQVSAQDKGSFLCLTEQ